jgi:hypothetical protein
MNVVMSRRCVQLTGGPALGRRLSPQREPSPLATTESGDPMSTAASPRTVAAGKLETTIERLRHALHEYRAELDQSEAAFARWQEQWRTQQAAIDQHLETIQSRLGPTRAAGGPSLAIVRPDE